MLLLPAIDNVIRKARKGKLSPRGIEWETRTELVRIAVPTNPTNTTDRAEAIRLCEQGRMIVREHGDLETALELFTRAFRLDNRYWEALVNQANILFLLGRVHDAVSAANRVRTQFDNIGLAYAKATLVIAKTLEMRILESASEEQQEADYRMISGLLEESLTKLKSHITTRTSLGRVMLLSGTHKETIEKFIEESLEYDEFAEAFLKALEAEKKLTERFREEFPALWKKLCDRRPEHDSE
jgi:tetratricopeptide (TPR) repeat protein